jgi:hypothetical protein
MPIEARARTIIRWYLMSLAVTMVLGFIVGWWLSNGQIIAAAIGSFLGMFVAMFAMRWTVFLLRKRLSGRDE